MNKYKCIIIVGQPGAGKGMLAKAIAEKLGWQFIDADLGLESRIGRTLLQIAGKSGATALYDCENEILAELLTRENIVVTTDASIVCSEANCQLLSKEFVVYLKVSIPVQREFSVELQKTHAATNPSNNQMGFRY